MQANFSKYLTITDAEERWGSYVTTVGCSSVAPHEHYPKEEHPVSHALTWNRGRRLNDLYVVFISKGRGHFDSGPSGPEVIAAGTCFILYPGVLHRYRPDPEIGWEEYWVGFNGPYFTRLMQDNFHGEQQPFINTGLNKDVLSLFNALLQTTKATLVGYPQQLAGITWQLLGAIHNIARNNLVRNNDPVQKLIDKALFMIQGSVETELDMERLAEQLPMGYSSFRKSFKQRVGQSPNQYHLNLRLSRAKDLLDSTILNVSEIAFNTGFESVFYFSRLFKKKFGLSPKAYRQTTDPL